TAEVSRWRLDGSSGGEFPDDQADGTPQLRLIPNPNVLGILGNLTSRRPAIVVGTAKERENVIERARKRLAANSCDLIVAYDISAQDILSGEINTVHVISADGVETWQRLSTQEIARRLIEELAAKLPAR